VEQLGNIPLERDDGTMRVLVSQMGGCASMKKRDIKIAATEHLIRKYDINLCAFMELNFNWTKVNSSANLASWFYKEERKLRLVTAHNTTEFNKSSANTSQMAQEWFAGMNISSMQGSLLWIQEG
jgi:hypothetical protein